MCQSSLNLYMISTAAQIKCSNCGALFTVKDVVRMVTRQYKKKSNRRDFQQQRPKEFLDALTRDDGPPYIRPWDSAGYNPRRYPKWIVITLRGLNAATAFTGMKGIGTVS
ncbi:MAG: hypothetical protein QXJ62_05085 [Nitrososphaeria archaeon]